MAAVTVLVSGCSSIRDRVYQRKDLQLLRIDRDARTVESQAVLSWGARVRFVDERRGCVLE